MFTVGLKKSSHFVVLTVLNCVATKNYKITKKPGFLGFKRNVAILCLIIHVENGERSRQKKQEDDGNEIYAEESER